MPLLQEVAELLSSEDVNRGIIEEIIYNDHMFNLLPFVPTIGKAYVYDREDGEGVGADFLNPNEDVQEGGAHFKEVVARLRILIGDVDVDKFLEGTMSDRMDQKAVQIAAKVKAVRAKFQRTVAAGDVSVDKKGFDGISKLVSPDMIISAGANGSAVSFNMLDELKDAVANGADGLIMRKGTWRAIKQLLRVSGGGNTADMFMVSNFGMQIPAFDGTPVIINDFLSGTEVAGTSTNTCSIYACRFNEADGLHGIYSANSPAGLVIEDIGTVQNRDATRTRVKWYAGLALKSTRSLACIRGVTNV